MSKSEQKNTEIVYAINAHFFTTIYDITELHIVKTCS